MTAPDIPLFDLRISPEDLAAVAATLRSGRLSAGPRVEEFEAAFAAHLGVRHALAVSSCTAALRLAYQAVGIGPGDEVIVPSVTFAATANTVLSCGATPVFADSVGSHDPGVDPAHVASLVTPRTRAVCAMHFAGYPAAVDVLRDLCDRHGIALVEDAAHAPAASLHGRALGTHGRVGAFSFFSNKVLSCGEGGLVATDDDEVAAAVRRLRDGAADVPGLGFNHRLDEPRAALLTSRLLRLGDDVEQRRRLVRRYRRLLAGTDGVSLPFTDDDVAVSSCYVMPVLVTDPVRQRPVRRALRDRHRIQTSLLYPACHEFTAFDKRLGRRSLPAAELWARSELTLPLHPHLERADQDRVVEALAAELAA